MRVQSVTVVTISYDKQGVLVEVIYVLPLV